MQRSNISLLCRTCLTSQGNIYPLSFTSTGHENINFATMLMSCTAVSILPNDSLPYHICEKCVCILITAYNFKEQCKKADIFLRRQNKIKLTQVKLGDIKIILSDTIVGEANTNTVNKVNLKLENDNVGKHNAIIRPIEMVLVKEELNDIDTVESSSIKREHSYNSEEDLKPKSPKYKRKSALYNCSKCDKVLTTQYRLMRHMENHSQSNSFTCPIENCEQKFLQKPTLKRHMLAHSNEKRFLCYICGKKYNAADTFWKHLKNHQDYRPYLCTCCGKSFKQSVHLKYHMHTHTGKRQFICTICNRAYLGPTQLKQHWRKFCGIGKDPPTERRRRTLNVD